MKTTKRLLSVLLAVLLLFSSAASGVSSLLAMAAGGSYFFYLTYSDIQAKKNSVAQNIGNNTIYSQQLIKQNGYQTVYLARNEVEGIQVYFHELGNDNETGRQLRVEVDPFLNANGDTLPFSVYEEIYFTEPTTCQYQLAEALVPYNGQTVETTVDENLMFYVELKSAKNQPAGVYASKVTAYDENGVLAVRPVHAIVWNFALPEARYSTTVMGLYNSASSYAGTKGFLQSVGVRFDNKGEILEEDVPFAESVLEAWDEVLLQHGIVPTELPRFLIDTDEKEAALKLADPRRSMYFVPILNYDGITSEVTAKIQQYKDLVYQNDILREKAMFYTADEASLPQADNGVYTAYSQRVSAIKTLWPGAHIFASTNYLNAFSKDLLEKTADMICLNQSLLVGENNEENRTFFTDSRWNSVFRYDGPLRSGSMNLFISPFSTNGPLRRCLYWQQEALQKKGGILEWNCAFLPTINGKLFDVWENNMLPPGSGIQTNDGDGLLLYPGTAIGLDATEPVVSLRMKQLVSGMDDYDYLQLAKECFGKDSDVYQTAMAGFLGSDYTPMTNSIYTIASWDVLPANQTRIALGNALSEAWTEDEQMHQYGDWETVVEPDATHNGLQIRTCATCGAEESRKLDPATACTHSFDAYTPVDADTHSGVCTLCGETVSLPHTPGAPTQENVVNATCTATGSYDEVIRCADCGYELSSTPKTNALLPHTYGTWVAEQAATCSATGVKGHYQCSVCQKYFDANKNEITDLTIQKNADNHAGPMRTDNQKAASCSAEGYTGDTVCTACGNTVTRGTAIGKIAHQWNSSTVTTQPTCTAAGVRTYQCNNCTATKTEAVAALGHAWGGWVVTKQPTCTQEGQQTRTCTRDGSHKETQPIAKKPHTDNGSGYCKDCGADLKASQRCKYCGEIHGGTFGWLIKFFHSILAIFKR